MDTITIEQREGFFADSIAALAEILDVLQSKPALNIRELKPENTVLVIVDVVKGFCVKGNLFSPRIKALVSEVERVMRLCKEHGIQVICFADSHPKNSPEYKTYPEHCGVGTEESELVDELKAIGGYRLFLKNSTSGFLEKEFQEWLEANAQITNMIVVGDCTDICVEQFASTAKAYYNMKNVGARIIVPMDTVETFDLGAHNARLMNTVAFMIMAGNGVELVQTVQ